MYEPTPIAIQTHTGIPTFDGCRRLSWLNLAEGHTVDPFAVFACVFEAAAELGVVVEETVEMDEGSRRSVYVFG